MGTSSAAKLRPEDIQANQILEDGGTRRVTSGRIQQLGPSLYGLIPHPISEMLGAKAGQDVDVYVNIEQGLVIHRIPEDDGPD